MVRSTLLAASCLLLVACPPPPVEPDAFVVRRDAARFDAPGDVEDDASIPGDAGDARPSDAGRDAFATDVGRDARGFDVGPCGPLSDVGDRCACRSPGATCSTASPCAAGLVCVTDSCFSSCQAGATGCLTDGDCASGSTCGASRVCIRASGMCGDSRDCPLGYACEGGRCADRRLPCGAPALRGDAGGPLDAGIARPGLDCPENYRCATVVGETLCVRANMRCVTDVNCPATYRCVDVEGDGPRECVPAAAACDSNTDCPDPALSCGFGAEIGVQRCVTHGLCATAADCASGLLCVDLWGDGVRECVLPGGCLRQQDCPPGTLCATPEGGGIPRCHPGF